MQSVYWGWYSEGAFRYDDPKRIIILDHGASKAPFDAP